MPWQFAHISSGKAFQGGEDGEEAKLGGGEWHRSRWTAKDGTRGRIQSPLNLRAQHGSPRFMQL